MAQLSPLAHTSPGGKRKRPGSPDEATPASKRGNDMPSAFGLIDANTPEVFLLFSPSGPKTLFRFYELVFGAVLNVMIRRFPVCYRRFIYV